MRPLPQRGQRPVDSGLHHVAFVAQYGLDHNLESRVDNGARVFGTLMSHF